MDYLPLFHNLKGRRVVVVGGGEIALRKVRLVQEASALITIIAKDFCVDLLAMAASDEAAGCNGLELITASYEHRLLLQYPDTVLVIAATNYRALNRTVSEHAQAANILSNVVDDPGFSTVIFPSIVDRSPIQVAISSGGDAPVLVRLLRTRFESLLPAGMAKLGALAGRFRERVKDKFSNGADRKAFWEEVFYGAVAEQAYANNLEEAERLLVDKLEHSDRFETGEVYLVGGGPGDPDLLTFKALRLMQQADIVLYDRLVSPQVLNLVRRDATRIYVGKTAGDHPVTQDNINQKLVDYALEGNRVVRLKGGDPFIFGRGGEEIETLAEHGIPFQVVPGITAASGCASYAGIPLTHRDHAQSVRFITGHMRGGKRDLNWPELVLPNQTLVFYMGLSGLETICQGLITHGLDETTPAALIEKGTTEAQQVLVGDLSSLPDIVRQAGPKAPTLIIVGHVVSLQSKLSWFNNPANRIEGTINKNNES
ncbi:MAG: uroporphyrinogen-III C-methyltransferase [Porticoccaceae bacterium]|nr:uroporphyrinogen-III C-methyltransferase [Porticoccaceae bacterium]MBT5578629.1 uroporphyrinogen-III C-methyltransferase [Porticoccaceae bacterium]MBT7375640.1 uroporphyrinogen-III C-methyltransferase [Porticoccaceae bacterium]